MTRWTLFLLLFTIQNAYGINPPGITAVTLSTGGIGVNNKGAASIVANPSLMIFQTTNSYGIHGSNLYGLQEYSSIAVHALYGIGQLRAGNFTQHSGSEEFAQTVFYQALAMKIHPKLGIGILIGIENQPFLNDYYSFHAFWGIGTTHQIQSKTKLNWCLKSAGSLRNSINSFYSSELGVVYSAANALNIHLSNQISSEGFRWNVGLEIQQKLFLFYTAKSRQMSAGYTFKFGDIQANIGLNFHQFLGASQAMSVQYEKH